MTNENPRVVLGDRKNVSVQDIYTELSKKFVKHEDVVKTLFNGYHSGNNVILYGPPGYGKSEMSEAFLNALGYTEDEIGIFSVNMDTAPEELFGNINMEKLYGENKFHMNIHQSVFSKEVVIFEELFDGTPAALAALKYVITKGTYFYNDQKYKIKTKFIIACTNKTTSEFNADNQETYRALIERFPIIKMVKWHSHTHQDYIQLLKKRFGSTISSSEYEGLGMIFQRSRFENGPVSPRIAITAVKSFLVGKDVNDLGYVLPDMDASTINESIHLFNSVKSEDLTQKIEEELMNKIIGALDPVIEMVESTLDLVLKAEDIYERLAGYEALQGLIKDIEMDFKDRIALSIPALQEVFNAKIYDRLSSIANKVTSHYEDTFAVLNSRKKDTLFAIYAKLSVKRVEAMKHITEISQ